MYARVFPFAAAFVLAVGASACDDGNRTALGPGPTSAASPFQSRLVSAEPATVHPEFLQDPTCRALRPFRTRFNLFVHTDRERLLHRVQFEFHDRAGGRTRPRAIPSASAASIPGMLPFHGTTVSPPFGTVGLTLDFDCGVRPEGTLFIDVETTDRDDVPEVAHVRVRVG